MDGESAKDHPGLGKIIYSVDDTPTPSNAETRGTNRQVDEDSKESFPASDPPAFSGGTATKDSGSNQV
ncbi:MAG: hypothetical protein U0031_18420 [Thermomicrobiales bacterium]